MTATVDAESLFRSILAAQYESRDPSVWVSTDRPDDIETLPLAIRVTVLPHTRRFTVTRPGISIDCWASDDDPSAAKIAARALALDVDAFITWQVARSVVNGVGIGLIDTVSGPAERPETNLRLRRFGMTYRPSLNG